jgi:hypothetical protein
MDENENMIAHRKWALEFLAKLNPGKQFDGGIFDDADLLVSFIVTGEYMPLHPDTQPLQRRDNMAAQPADPFNINTGLAQ